MMEKVLTKEDWVQALRGVTDSYRIFVPVKRGDFHDFILLEEGTRPNFNFQNSRLSPKSIVYPQSERMFECSTDPEDPEANILKEAPKEYVPQAVVGIRPCDVHGFRIVKRNFDNPEFRDPWWVQRFESTLLIGLGCNEPCPTCFCASVGGGPFNKEGLDIILYNLNDRFLVRTLTERGEEFLEKTKGGSPPGETDLKEAEGLEASASEKINKDVPTGKLREKVVNELFGAPFCPPNVFGFRPRACRN